MIESANDLSQYMYTYMHKLTDILIFIQARRRD